jgi:H+/Cl- antiporter ClcA
MRKPAKEPQRSWFRRWLPRLAWIFAGLVVGAVAGAVWLLAVFAALWMLSAGSDNRSSSSSVSWPDGAWKWLLGAAISVIIALGLLYQWGWWGVVIGGAGIGSPIGGFAGLAMRMSRERKQRLEQRWSR